MEKINILLLDDDNISRTIIQSILKKLNYSLEIREVNNAEDAIKIIPEFNPDIAILDIVMPGETNGLDVCNFIKLNREYKKIFVALLTSQSDKADVYLGMEANANLYITKPFNAKNIESIVESYLRYKTT